MREALFVWKDRRKVGLFLIWLFRVKCGNATARRLLRYPVPRNDKKKLSLLTRKLPPEAWGQSSIINRQSSIHSLWKRKLDGWKRNWKDERLDGWVPSILPALQCSIRSTIQPFFAIPRVLQLTLWLCLRRSRHHAHSHRHQSHRHSVV